MDWTAVLGWLEGAGISILNVFVALLAFVVNPFLSLCNPPLQAFVPLPVAPPATIEKHSIADYQILYGADATPAEITAANTLADTLRQITGVNYAARQGAPTGAKEILVGQLGGADVAALGDEGYLIKPQGDSIIITGGRPRGTLYGVYRFLEEYFDCHWYTAELKVIPTGAAEIADVREESYVPPLEYRETDWISPHDTTYSIANRLNANSYRQLSAADGGTMGYANSFAHTFINAILRPAEYFDAHPEYYAYRDSEKTRVPKQLCLTNPDVLRLVIDQVKAYWAQPGHAQIVCLTQDDNQSYCECANCKAVDAAEGSHAGTMIRFVNAVSEALADDPVYDDLLLDTFAYQYTRTPPQLVKPRANVIVRLCSIECCFAHPLDDPNCPDNAVFAADLKKWSEICERLYVWDYTTNYSHYNAPFPNFQVLQPNMQFFVQYNVKGVYEEGNYSASECNSEFAELRAYMLTRLMWDPALDYEAEMAGFMAAYYGEGWQYIREFIRLIGDNTGVPDLFGQHRRLSIGRRPIEKELMVLNQSQVRYADQLWAKAIALAGAETARQNVLRSQLCWRFWKGCNRVEEFSWLLPIGQWQAANKALYADFQAFGIVRYAEGSGMITDTPNYWQTPMEWRKG
ncbi:MAG: DUF4838 domain-containing protein [Oscillospiraceae bacterium]|nr:DUF4838 domain-containing protein [Oscillospiraceae bacterium]